MRIKRLALSVIVVLLAGSLVVGCQTGTEDGQTFPVTVKDDLGRKVGLPAEPERIVSLAPANTEILFALGLGDRVVGVTSFCDYPREASKKAKIGDFMNPNIEAIVALQPDLVLGTTGVQQGLVEALARAGIKLYASEPADIAGVMTNIEEIGRLTGRTEEAKELAASMKKDVSEVKAKVAGTKRPTVFYEVSYDPLYTAGRKTFIDDIIRISRGQNVAGKAGEGYLVYSLESLVTEDPAIYLAVQGSMNDPSQIEKRSGYEAITAVRTKRVYTVDDNLVSRPGPRITKGLKQVAKILHPDAFK